MKTTLPFNQPVASRVLHRVDRSARSQTGRLVTFCTPRRTAKTPASAVMTRKNAHDAPCAGLNAGIRRALDVSRLPESGFVAQQIAIHQKFEAGQTEKMTFATRLQRALAALETIAVANEWSQTKLAAKIEVKESSFRKIKSGRADSTLWLPKLEAAVARLAKPEVRHA